MYHFTGHWPTCTMLAETIRFDAGALPSPVGDGVMGMVYDEGAGAWRLDYPCRVNGRPTHLKDSIYGPQRKTQAQAMRRWLELEDQARDPNGSLSFSDDVAKYIEANPHLADNQRRVIGHLAKALGHLRRHEFAEAFKVWIADESRRNVARSMTVYPAVCPHCKDESPRSRRGHCKGCGVKLLGVTKVVDTGKRLSPATIQAYKRVVKTITNMAGYGDCLKKNRDRSANDSQACS